MSTSNARRYNRLLGVRARVMLRLEAEGFRCFFSTFVLAAPLALLSTSGFLFVLGILYALIYAAVMLPGTALLVLSSVDAARVLTRRDAVFVPYMRAIQRQVEKDDLIMPRRRKSKVAGEVVSFILDANPLALLTRELWYAAFRFNPDAPKRLDQQVDETSVPVVVDRGPTVSLLAREGQRIPRREAGFDIAIC